MMVADYAEQAKLLADAINAGVWDSELDRLERAVTGRLARVRPALSLADFPVDSRARFNQHIDPAYLKGKLVRVIAHRTKNAVVVLEDPAAVRLIRSDSRFVVMEQGVPVSIEITVPIRMLERV